MANGAGSHQPMMQAYDIHGLHMQNWNAGQPLEGPGMPVSRSAASASVSAHAVTSSASANVENMEGTDGDIDEKTYCTCQNYSHGEMIACDGSECPTEWVSSAFGLCVFLESRPMLTDAAVPLGLYWTQCGTNREVVLRRLSPQNEAERKEDWTRRQTESGWLESRSKRMKYSNSTHTPILNHSRLPLDLYHFLPVILFSLFECSPVSRVPQSILSCTSLLLQRTSSFLSGVRYNCYLYRIFVHTHLVRFPSRAVTA